MSPSGTNNSQSRRASRFALKRNRATGSCLRRHECHATASGPMRTATRRAVYVPKSIAHCIHALYRLCRHASKRTHAFSSIIVAIAPPPTGKLPIVGPTMPRGAKAIIGEGGREGKLEGGAGGDEASRGCCCWGRGQLRWRQRLCFTVGGGKKKKVVCR